MKVLAIGGLALRRLLRDRIALFFVLLLPALIILLIGYTIFREDASSKAQVGVINDDGGPLGNNLVSRLGKIDLIIVSKYADLAALRQDIRRETIDAGVVVPAKFSEDLQAGKPAEVSILSPTVDPAAAVRSTISSQVSELGTQVRAAVFTTANGGGSFDENLERAGRLSHAAPEGVVVEAENVQVGEVDTSTTPSGFQYPAASNLVLFIFITSLAGAGQLVDTRLLGISHRMLGTPTSARTILLGEGLGRFVIAAFQGLFIFGLGTVLFGVDWGDLRGAAILIVAFCLVGTAFAMLAGSLFRTQEQAGAVGPPVGIALGMLGGCMWPLEIVGSTMRNIGHATPHAWAMDGFVDLIGRGQNYTAVLPEVGVLLGIAFVLFPLAIWRLRARLVT